MEWVVQKNIFRPENYRLLLDGLANLGVTYHLVNVLNGSFDLEPEVTSLGKIYVCGALKMASISKKRGWSPGSFLNENFDYRVWGENLSSELLNADVIIGRFDNIEVPKDRKFFVRPLVDDKAFDGMVIDYEMLVSWRKDSSKSNLLSWPVVVSEIKPIYSEFRLFIVKNKIVTGSVYKRLGRPEVSPLLENDVLNYAEKIIKKWLPYESCVIDIAYTDNGYKVIEFNNINSSGFYASDVERYIDAIQLGYG